MLTSENTHNIFHIIMQISLQRSGYLNLERRLGQDYSRVLDEGGQINKQVV